MVEVYPRHRTNGEYERGVTFSGGLAETIFSKNYINLSIPLDKNRFKFDTYNTYTLNSYNNRGPEPTSGVDFITSGCSQTFGIGVPDDGVWPKFLSSELNATYADTSTIGASIEWIVDSVFRYINTFGKPTRGVVLLLPDVRRVDLMVDGEVSSCKSSSWMDYRAQSYDVSNPDIRLMSYHINDREESKANFIKRPFPIEETTSDSQAIFQSIKAIKHLEIFCEQSGINLAWSTWSESFDLLINDISEEYPFKYYVPGISDYIVDGSVLGVGCHGELEKTYELCFHAGTDRLVNIGQSHMGVHKHLHVANQFAKYIEGAGI